MAIGSPEFNLVNRGFTPVSYGISITIKEWVFQFTIEMCGEIAFIAKTHCALFLTIYNHSDIVITFLSAHKLVTPFERMIYGLVKSSIGN